MSELDRKISQLPLTTSIAGDESIPVVQSGVNKKAPPSQILKAADTNALPGVLFDTATPSAETAVGITRWNADEETLETILTNGTILQHGQEIHYHVTNGSASQIDNGTLVMATDAEVGASGKIIVQPYDGTSPSKTIMGIATQNIPPNNQGYVTHFGKVRNVDTSGGAENWEPGDILYADPDNAGKLTKILPAAPNTKTTVAFVIHDHASSGILFVRPTYAANLGEDELVELSGLATNDMLVYTAAGRFENASPTEVRAALDFTTVVEDVDLGQDPNELPLNQFLGALAYQDLPQVRYELQPTVPATSPTVQNVIDALIALGLVRQED